MARNSFDSWFFKGATEEVRALISDGYRLVSDAELLGGWVVTLRHQSNGKRASVRLDENCYTIEINGRLRKIVCRRPF